MRNDPEPVILSVAAPLEPRPLPSRLSRRHQGLVPLDHPFRRALLQHSPPLQQDRPVAELGDGLQVVADEENGLAPAAQMTDSLDAPVLKNEVPHRQGLIHQQDVRVHVDGYGEGQPHEHSGGIDLDRLVHEFADPGELQNVVLALLHLPLGEPHDGAGHEHVLPSRELGIEPGTQLQQGRDGPSNPQVTRGLPMDSGHELQQRALARSVPSHDAQRRPGGHFQVDLPQGPEFPVQAPPLPQKQLQELVARTPVDPVFLGDLPQAHHRRRLRGHRRTPASSP